MAGDRGSSYNAFTLFLIFILLYLAQKGTDASAYSENVQTETDQFQTPAEPPEKKVAVGLSDGDVTEYPQSTVIETEEEMEEEQEIVVPEPAVIEETELTDETQAEEEQAAPEVIIEEPVEEIRDPIEESTVDDASLMDEIQTNLQEMVEVNVPEPQAEDTSVGSAESEVTDEPVLGGQSNLFLKPTVMTGIHPKKQTGGPKVSIKFGS